jgi:hypothetical protein
MSSSNIKTAANVTYGIMTMIYLLLVGVLNTLGIRVYQEDVIIPYNIAKKTVEDIKENFGQELKTEVKETSVVDKNAIAIIEALMMAVTIPLAFGYIIGFDCSCAANGDPKFVGKIIFCLGIFIPIIYIIVSDIISLLFPDNDYANPFLPPNSPKEQQDKHVFNRQYRKTFCWSLITLTFIIHFFSVAFGSNSSSGRGGGVDYYG